ncbi:hypothetical protein Plhal304r1_c018g0064841 [Plasmopara halstedii]
MAQLSIWELSRTFIKSSVRREALKLLHLDTKKDPMANDRHSSFHPFHLNLNMQARTSKSMDDGSRLRKLMSLSYLGGKLRGIFQRDLRDTIMCDEDEAIPRRSKRNIYDIIHQNDDTTHFDHLAKFSDCMPCDRPTALSTSALMLVGSNEPSKEQRWCTNCSKGFQRGLSRFDQYCGLDCKTAHRMRQASHYLTPQSPSLVSEEMIAVRAAALRPPPRYTIRSATT